MKICWTGPAADRTQMKKGSGLNQAKAEEKREKIIAVPETCGTLSNSLRYILLYYYIYLYSNVILEYTHTHTQLRSQKTRRKRMHKNTGRNNG